MSSMKQSALPYAEVGIETDISLLVGVVSFRHLGLGYFRLDRTMERSRIQFLQEGSSLLRSVTISGRLHHDGGLGDPPNDNRSAMYATSHDMMTYYAAAFPECAILW